GVQMSNAATDVSGVVIDNVQDPGPAHEAGLQNKDVVTACNGKPTFDAADLSALVRVLKPGQTVKLTVQRGGKTLTIDVVLGEHPYE
ncbi:MAG: PDZ domain-containing protein, partial [Phycisphaerae bacterium]|nr:PDZ domain-containing protein [Phycisphaerae bacterium]